MSARKLSDWLQAYMEFTRNTESPVSYHTWVGIGVIASALERKVYMQWGHSQIFPNQYIVLIGPSGRVRKGDAITIGRSLLKDGTTTHITSEAITRQGLIKRMRLSLDDFRLDDRIQKQCAVTCIAEEMSVFLGEADTTFLADMCNWYDSRDDWSYETKHGGVERIDGVCLNIIGAMAEDWIPQSIPPGAIGGGFTSRIVFIVEHEKGRVISDPSEYPVDEKLRAALLHDIERIHIMTGEAKFTPDAKARYITWYEEEEERAQKGFFPITDPRFGGYNSRRATHVKKIAMAVSAARSDSLQVTAEDFERGLNLMLHAEMNMPQVFGKVGTSGYTEQMQNVIEYLRTHEVATKQEVLRRFYRDLDLRTLETIESTLEEMGAIKVDIDPKARTRIYRWCPPNVTQAREAPQPPDLGD